MEWWNIGILEEGTLGRDERLLVLGTQARASPSAMEGHAQSWPIPAPEHISLFPSFQHSNIPTFQ